MEGRIELLINRVDSLTPSAKLLEKEFTAIHNRAKGYVEISSKSFLISRLMLNLPINMLLAYLLSQLGIADELCYVLFAVAMLFLILNLRAIHAKHSHFLYILEFLETYLRVHVKLISTLTFLAKKHMLLLQQAIKILRSSQETGNPCSAFFLSMLVVNTLAKSHENYINAFRASNGMNMALESLNMIQSLLYAPQ